MTSDENAQETAARPSGHAFGFFEQLSFLWFELSGLKHGIPLCLFNPESWIVLHYRLDRAFYLMIGNRWRFIRLVLFPLRVIAHNVGASFEVPYGADIGKGFRVLHPCLGVVIHSDTVCGENLCLAGGNAVGIDKAIPGSNNFLGNNVFVGVNATIMGPVRIGDNVKIGANSVVTHDVVNMAIVGGVPARVIRVKQT